jgi:hypothetical protein
MEARHDACHSPDSKRDPLSLKDIGKDDVTCGQFVALKIVSQS